jgi:hypothetical protein
MRKFSAHHIWQNVVKFHPIWLFSMLCLFILICLNKKVQ